jgi:hypothetical protein
VPVASVPPNSTSFFFRAEFGCALLVRELTDENDWNKMAVFEAAGSIEEVRKTVESDISGPTTSNR